MKSVSDMLRSLHLIFLYATFALLAFVIAENNEEPQPKIKPQPNANDLEADATSYWGGRPYGGYGWGGYGRGYGWGGWGGRYGWGGRGFYGGRGWDGGWNGYWG